MGKSMRMAMGLKAALALFALGVFAFAPSAMAVKVITVDSTADELDDDVGDSICHTASGHCTLRAAVMQAVNNNPSVTDAVKIIVPAGTYTFTIPVAEGGGALIVGDTLNGDPIIEIEGAGAALTIIDANHIDTVFLIQQRRVVLSGMTIRNGSTIGAGGGIYSLGNLTINAVSILSNNAGDLGGGIYQTEFASSGLNIYASTIAYNNAENGGGGIYTEDKMVIANSTIAANTTTGAGGGIENSALDVSFAVNVYNTTIAFNDADHKRETGAGGGGIYVNVGSAFNLYNSVIAGNTVSNTPTSDDCLGPVSTHARNRFGSEDGCSITQVSGSYALLSPNVLGNLQDNGGPTLTIALPSGSNAINAGDPTFGCLDINGNTFLTDQRGFFRNVGICDLGSYESGSLDPNDRVFTDGFEILPPPIH